MKLRTKLGVRFSIAGYGDMLFEFRTGYQPTTYGNWELWCVDRKTHMQIPAHKVIRAIRKLAPELPHIMASNHRIEGHVPDRQPNRPHESVFLADRTEEDGACIFYCLECDETYYAQSDTVKLLEPSVTKEYADVAGANEKLDLTREKIRQIEDEAHARIRNANTQFLSDLASKKLDQLIKKYRNDEEATLSICRARPEHWKEKPVKGFVATYPLSSFRTSAEVLEQIERDHGGSLWEIKVRARQEAGRLCYVGSTRHHIDADPKLEKPSPKKQYFDPGALVKAIEDVAKTAAKPAKPSLDSQLPPADIRALSEQATTLKSYGPTGPTGCAGGPTGFTGPTGTTMPRLCGNQIYQLRNRLIEITSGHTIITPVRWMIKSVYVIPTPGYVPPWETKEERPRPYGEIVISLQGRQEFRAPVSTLMDAYTGLMRNPALEKVKELDALAAILLTRVQSLKERTDEASITELQQILAIMEKTANIASTFRMMPGFEFVLIDARSNSEISARRVRRNSDGEDETIDEEVRCILNVIECIELC